MKQINGIAHNVSDDIFGRITFSPQNIFNRNNTILVVKGATDIPRGYVAIITDTDNLKTNRSYVGAVQSLDSFNEGDIVVINRDGEIMFVYEINSVSNSIFVTGK